MYLSDYYSIFIVYINTMSCLLYVNDQESTGKINIDELFDKNQRRDLRQVSIFNKILGRIHTRITKTGKNKLNEKYIWFTVPEYIFGEPVYDNAECIAYIVAKLETNGFFIKYVHPNTLFVSWEKWIPVYVRQEFKKRTGKIIDEKGVITEIEEEGSENGNSKIINEKTGGKSQKQYTPIDKYKPTGNLVYSPDFFEKIEKKVSFI
jgi:hypothetical protein